MPRSSITGSCSSFIFNFLKNLHTAFHNGCPYLHSHQQCKSSCFATSSPAFLFLIALDSDHSNWGEMKSKNYFNLHPFIIRAVEHFFVYLLAIFSSFFENSLFNSYAHFFIGVLILQRLSFFWVPYRFWILVPYQMSSWQRFSPMRLSFESSYCFLCCAEAL
jgi:hypothetical protein